MTADRLAAIRARLQSNSQEIDDEYPSLKMGDDIAYLLARVQRLEEVARHYHEATTEMLIARDLKADKHIRIMLAQTFADSAVALRAALEDSEP